jgi:hypothetical protein
MSFSKLHAKVQQRDCPISTKWLKEEALELSEINRIREQWSALLDGAALRGFYIEGPLDPPVPLAEHESLIVISRSLCTGPQGAYWRRFVFTKELMHVFDEADEKAGDGKTFDVQIEKIHNPAVESSPQFRAETKAFWRALAVLCPEKKRVEFKKQIDSGAASLDVVSAALRLPATYVRNLVRPDFSEIVKAIMGK